MHDQDFHQPYTVPSPGARIDRPNTELAAKVEAAMATLSRLDCVKCLIELRLSDAAIARLLCERANTNQRRRSGNSSKAPSPNVVVGQV